MKRFSVIFCTYNREKYIYNALQSIAKECYPIDNYEIVLINNKSTDTTELLCNKFRADYPNIDFRYFIEENQGLSYARNRGVEESKGEILVFVDDDATVFDNYLKSIDELFVAYPDARACGGTIQPVYEVDKPKWLCKYTEELLGGALFGGNNITLFKHGRFPGGCNTAFRREVFDTYGLFNVDLGRKGTGLIGAEEKDLFDRLSKAGEKFYYVPKMGIYHYISEKKLSIPHFHELTYSIGISERIRTKSISQSAYKKRIRAEIKKWIGTFVLFGLYTLKLTPSKGIKLLQFRWNVSKGLLGK